MTTVIYAGGGALALFVVLHRGSNPWAFGFFGGLAVALVALLVSKLLFPFACPQCGKGLGRVPREKFAKVTQDLRSVEGIAACPHCGSSFDVPMAP